MEILKKLTNLAGKQMWYVKKKDEGAYEMRRPFKDHSYDFTIYASEWNTVVKAIIRESETFDPNMYVQVSIDIEYGLEEKMPDYCKLARQGQEIQQALNDLVVLISEDYNRHMKSYKVKVISQTEYDVNLHAYVNEEAKEMAINLVNSGSIEPASIVINAIPTECPDELISHYHDED